jgi:Sec7-like guanine-nucleotide exchange factor
MSLTTEYEAQAKLLSTMPPMKNDSDLSKSGVVSYIQQKLECDISEAVRTFEALSHWGVGILVFEKMSGCWMGREWRPKFPPETPYTEAMLAMLVCEMTVLRAEVRKLRNGANSVSAKKYAWRRNNR